MRFFCCHISWSPLSLNFKFFFVIGFKSAGNPFRSVCKVHTEIKLSYHLVTNAEAQNGSKVLHIIVEKVNKLIVCPQMIVMLRYTK